MASKSSSAVADREEADEPLINKPDGDPVPSAKELVGPVARWREKTRKRQERETF